MSPTRMCVSCRKRNQKENLTRISSQNGVAVVDNNKNQTARAIYVCREQKCVEILKKSRAIERMLKVQVSENFYDNLI